MRRTLLLALLCAVAALGCTSKSSSTTTTTPPAPAAPGSTGTAGPTGDRSTPEAAVRTLFTHLQDGNCELIFGDATAAAANVVINKAGSREKACDGFARAAKEIVANTTLVDAKLKSADAANAQVTLLVRDRVGHEDSSVVPLTREAEAWKVSKLDVP